MSRILLDFVPCLASLVLFFPYHFISTTITLFVHHLQLRLLSEIGSPYMHHVSV